MSETPAPSAAPFDPREPKAEDAIALAGRPGWEFFDGPNQGGAPTHDPKSEKHQRLALIAMVLWNVAEFRELMEHILDVTLRRSVHVAHLGLPMDQAWGYGIFREGQNTMAEMILKMIAEGRRQVAAPPRDV